MLTELIIILKHIGEINVMIRTSCDCKCITLNYNLFDKIISELCMNQHLINKLNAFTSETVFNIVVKLLKQIAISMGNHNCINFCKSQNRVHTP